MSTSEQSRYLTSRQRLLFLMLVIIWMLGPARAKGQIFTILYDSEGGAVQHPLGELVLDKLGNLYGTTENQTLFELKTSGEATTLYSFTGASGTGDGSSPTGPIVRFAGGLFGTTSAGGSGGCSGGCGTVFGFSHDEESIIHAFTFPEGDGPLGGIARDQLGNLYGTLSRGGSGVCGTWGCGAVFEVSEGQEKILHTFTDTPDGAAPSGSLILDRAGNIYGTTSRGGSYGYGTVFELSPSSNGSWTAQVLFSFPGKSAGATPRAGLIMDVQGNLYGTTQEGGWRLDSCSLGCGIVFKLKKNLDGSWVERVLHVFGKTTNDGLIPVGNLVRDKKGNIYGVTSAGGAAHYFGTVFKVDDTAHETVLHSFTGQPSDGSYPRAGLIADTAGSLYGTTTMGGALNYGTVFKVSF